MFLGSTVMQANAGSHSPCLTSAGHCRCIYGLIALHGGTRGEQSEPIGDGRAELSRSVPEVSS